MPNPLFTVPLRFDRAPGGVGDPERLRTGLSAIERTGDHLWVACDETPTLERLTLRADGSYGEHRTYALGELLELADEGEVDVEGLAYAAPYLWVIGSHSRRRSKARDEDDDEASIRRLAKVEEDPSRYFLARIPLVNDPDGGGLVPCRSAPDPLAPGSTLTAARLRGKGAGGGLVSAFRDDAHLRRFRKIPGKDNGLDVEGLAEMGGRVFIGLRGPVLRGWAMVIEVEPAPDPKRPERLRLRRIGDDGERYRKHFLELDGMGVRDLRRDGDDLLVLAGATMQLSAPSALYRWRGGAVPGRASLVRAPELERVLDLPYYVGQSDDHPEGVVLFGAGKPRSVMVVYDAVEERRLVPHGVRADVFQIPG